MTRLRLAAALTAASVLLVACGGGDDDSKKSDDSSSSSDSTPTVAAATGEKLTADDFTMNAPEGWKSNDGSAAPAVNFEVLAIDPEDKDGFADNVNVVPEPGIAKIKDSDDLAKAAEQGLASLNPENLKVEDPVTIDGEKAVVVSYTAKPGSAEVKQIQYYVGHDDTGFVVTFSFSPDRPQSEQDEIAQSVAASWKWAA